MDAVPRRELTLLDSVCLIVGIIVGAGIYQMAPDIARGASGGGGLLALWLLGGLLSLCGAMSYAELATAYPQEGGDYAYLTKAYGRWAGFLFGWIQLAIVRPGDIAVMAFAFATYAWTIYDPLKDGPLACSQQVYACLAVVVLTVINVAGVRQGKWTQNLLTGVKVLGLAAIVGVAVCAPQGAMAPRAVEPLPASLALILVLFTFGGWNEMAYVAAEVINPSRNIVRALLLGTASVTVLYLLVNGAFLYTLGYQGLAASQAVATETVSTVFPAKAPALISALVCASALGAVNGLIFTGARISFAVGADHRVFRPLGRWDASTGTPVRALLLQAAIAITLIVSLGSFLNAILYTAAPVYLFYLATSLAVIVLRRKEPRVERPYRVWGYPFTTFIFCLTCAFLAYSAVRYKPWIALAALGILLAGIPLYGLSSRRLRASGEATG
ncbi:MAG TPA: amino acid permease [Phycisphaerae bacterium]|nr:amino acid permease [Phycisphaerae bacterium]HRY70916.1 amino acid permease [Phycisphaerae bacterium]HSA27787.1 amino acid permease [Phycisphaerae bacterium]